jgi:DNA helicase-2/ATP-dependent DNA helicase PcrA
MDKKLYESLVKPPCPKCGGETTLRFGSKGGFYGCNRYPACYGTRDAEKHLKDVRAGKFGVDSQQNAENSNDPNHSVGGVSVESALDDKNRILAEARARVKKGKGKTQKAFKPSPYQQAIFDWITDGQGKNLVVEAGAGSGKTTTGVMALELLDPTLDIAFIAFNAHIVKELKTQAPQHVNVMTYHSLGYRQCRTAWGNDIVIDEDKVRKILMDILDKHTQGALFGPICRIVSLVKANLLGTSIEEIQQITDHHGIELNGDEELVLAAVQLVVEVCADQTNAIDYDDMCWLPIIHDLQSPKYDFVFVDEAQDTNKNQIQLALRAVKKSGRIIAVGDRNQSLYGFRGADVDAIPNLIESLDADTLPLSITYRNPVNVVDLVNREFPHIPLEAADFAKPGTVINITSEEASRMYEAGDMVLCRCNAPLVGPAFELIRNGTKAIIRGRDIGKNLMNLINKFSAKDVGELMKLMEKYRNKEVKKLLDAEKNQQAQSLEDKIETVMALADGCDQIYEIEQKIKTIFSDRDEGVVFSSVHKAKGLEAERVFILQPDLMPHPMAKKAWEMVQEVNIQYVAYTRSLDTLAFVEGV